MNFHPLHNNPNNKAIAIWLFICCFTIFAMIVLGGATRLTGSGLSMVTWKPIMGILPPLSQAAWDQAFLLYQQSPEFQFKNSHMDLEAFKGIFWFEYSHRVLGRFIGVIFFFPMVYFFIRKQVSSTLKPKLIGMFVLGGLQGVLGWYMVKSGLVDDPHVSQYRLTAHLGLALLIFSYSFWVALELIYPKQERQLSTSSTKFKNAATATLVIIFTTALSGGFVAGLKAGFIYNTFPLMGDSFFPPELFALEPLWRNFFENAVTAQFDHRILAGIVTLSVAILWFMAQSESTTHRTRHAMNFLVAALLLQLTLGITTLLLEVPIVLGTAHQGGAVILITAVLNFTHAVRNS